MYVSYSTKHAEGKISEPKKGTKISDGIYVDTLFPSTNKVIMVAGKDLVWLDPLWSQVYNKGNYSTKGDSRFATLPKGSVIIFTQE